MSFRLFIYYCALCGGWAALVAWALVFALGLTGDTVNTYLGSTLIAGILGLLVAAGVGALDALLNAGGTQRLWRVVVCLSIGCLGGVLGGLVAEGLDQVNHYLRVVGWMLVGTVIGSSVGIFDLFRALRSGEQPGMAARKVVNGLVGGALGGLTGGLFFEVLTSQLDLPRSGLAIGLVVLGLCIGLMIGLAQVILREVWLRVEAGFRPGRELIVSKGEITLGRAESCDLGLFGDPGIERLHARILHQGRHYLLADAGTPGGTFLNEQRITQPSPLRSGDAIRVGKSVVRFGERRKRK
jgi:hypothetical protein